ncbi:MAG: PepSY domain-containing protein, partial [Clostridia bacterium]
HAGVNEKDVTLKKAKFDREDGQYIYEIEFVAANVEYDYEISAADAAVLEYQAKTVKNAVVTKPDKDNAVTGNISLEEAKAIAFEHAGVEESIAMIKKAKLDRKDGQEVYEIEFYTSSREFEYEISAADGRIIEYDIDNRD